MGGVFYPSQNIKFQKVDLIVLRVGKNGETCNARPCYNCLNMMKAVGIRKVYYSVSFEKIICENVKDMVSIQSSSVNRYIEKICRLTHSDDNTNKYYENLLVKYFPKIIRKHNLDSFINYNLFNVLPTYKIKFTQAKTKVLIFDNNNKIVVSGFIVP